VLHDLRVLSVSLEKKPTMTQTPPGPISSRLPDWPDYGLLDDVRGPLFAALAQGRPAVLATLVRVEGGGPRPPGAQMLFTDDGQGAMAAHGFLSGGCVEGDVALHAAAVMAGGLPLSLVYGPSGPWPDIRLLCGAEIEVLVERVLPGDPAAEALKAFSEERTPALWTSDGLHRRCEPAGPARMPKPDGQPVLFQRLYDPRPRLIVVGSDPAALAMASLGAQAGFETWLNRPKGPRSPPPVPGLGYLRQTPDEALAVVGLDRWTAVAVASHDADTDHPALVAALSSDAGYVGLLGARRRLPERLAALRAAGISEPALARLHAPIGLDLGGKAPWEVAVSVIAEIIRLRYRPG
jgi:xanthine dehydrogenase accessory factor